MLSMTGQRQLVSIFLIGSELEVDALHIDVVKTRLQSQQRAGQTVYNGIFDGLRKIFQEEGLKGGVL